jgi:NAD(P)-dependent dehydrogenase (short-subunit alcohol dehydrogenase family)
MEDRLIQRFEKQDPMGYWADPSELADSVVFLASKASDYVTATFYGLTVVIYAGDRLIYR